MNRMEITLKNDQSANPGSIFDSPLLVGLVTAGSAIFGAFMGSYMTNRIEKQRQKELREEREKQKERIAASVFPELKEISFWLGNIRRIRKHIRNTI